MKLTACIVAAALQAQSAMASQATSICDTAALRAAETHGVPPQVMLAIARVETGRIMDGTLQPWPWAVNQAGMSHWFESPSEAEDFVRAAIEGGSSNIDIGCFQLNLRWHGKEFSSLQEMFDPTANANYAARFLQENHDRKGNWVDAVAAYHSATPAYAEAYIKKVAQVLDGISSINLQTQPGPTDNAGSPNRFPLLQPGTGGTMASLVPIGRATSPFLTASR